MKQLKELVTARDVMDSGADQAAINALLKAFEIQGTAFLAHPNPDVKERRAHLEALAGMMLTSGDACVNACAIQGALPSFGFGGSGMGRHHGIHGFREFSNPRGVFVRDHTDLIDAFSPTYGDTLSAITTAAYGQAM